MSSSDDDLWLPPSIRQPRKAKRQRTAAPPLKLSLRNPRTAAQKLIDIFSRQNEVTMVEETIF